MLQTLKRVVVLDHPDPRGLDPALVGPQAELIDASGRADAHELCHSADVVLADAAPVTAELVGRMRRCRLICSYGVGVDNIDVAAATAAGIHVSRAPSYCVEELADHTLALILASTRGIVRYHDHVRSGGWDHCGAGTLRRTRGRVLGLLGLGRVGRAVAARAAAFGFRVLATVPVADGPHAAFAELVPLERLVAEADVLSLHAPLTPDTRHVISAAELAAMKPTAYLVNTARGGLVDQPALLAALRDGRPAGAALDVLATEPPHAHEELLALPNVIVTPHAGFYSEESLADLTQEVFSEVRAALNGDRPRNAINQPAVRGADRAAG
ncbi:C-terminal binding protein [Nonomuraea longispora]|uniref:C-terminal binding protein n=1 Tax=Nonomuraea longispora TaxID=1848320 RepID=A0A4R4NAP7_9ACTN|nr:C-terminal binding protein [Nonomuraea longispora]TDC03612.1 C-terminal binding protein [Nonomuraea longispora]